MEMVAPAEVREKFALVYAQYVVNKIITLCMQNCAGGCAINPAISENDDYDFEAYFDPETHYWCNYATPEEKMDRFFEEAMNSVDQTDILVEYFNEMKQNYHIHCLMPFVDTFLTEIDEKIVMYFDIENLVRTML